MELSKAEDRLFDRLTAPRDISTEHLKALDHKVPGTLGAYACIGVDTNVLKRFRRDLSLAEKFFASLEQENVKLVVPRQCIVEFWNNHQIFASEDWETFRSDLGRLSKKLDLEGATGAERQKIEEIVRLVDDLSSGLQESKSPEYLSRSRELVKSILDAGTVPMVSRIRFAELARIRSSSRTPPGFADEKLKIASFGDFFVWCDLMLGALCLDEDLPTDKDFAWVTEDSKPDWKTGQGGNPSLLEEFAWVCDARLSVLSLDDLRKLLKDVGVVSVAGAATDPDALGDHSSAANAEAVPADSQLGAAPAGQHTSVALLDEGPPTSSDDSSAEGAPVPQIPVGPLATDGVSAAAELSSPTASLPAAELGKTDS